MIFEKEEGGTPDLGIRRDSLLPARNNYALFAEEFESVLTPYDRAGTLDPMSTTTDVRWQDLLERLNNAATALDDLRRNETDFSEKNRIDAKASGVRLAISYMEDMM